MYLKFNNKQWEISRARQTSYHDGVQFSFTFKECLEIEQLRSDLDGIELGFEFSAKTYVGYSISDLSTTYDESGFEVTELVLIKPIAE